MRRLVIGVVVAMLASSSVASAVAPGFAPGTTTRVSVATDGTPANASLQSQVLSQDGRYVVFASSATDLVTLATGGRLQVYRHDRVSGVTELVSLSRTGVASTGSSFAPTLSADGRFVAFVSTGTDLVAGDTNGVIDVFVRDMTNGTTTAASTDASGAFVVGATSLANFPGARALSDDGRYVAFSSTAPLVPGANGVAQVYVKDLSSGVVVRASVDATGNAGDGASGQATISGDGNVVAFQSTSTSLSSVSTGGQLEIYSRDLAAGVTTLDSVSTAGAAAGLVAAFPGLSHDGRYLVFETAAQLDATDTDTSYDVYLRDRSAQTTTLASPGGGGVDNRAPSISADGAYVAFHSSDSTLVAGDANNVSDVFLWNRATGAYTLVSLNDAGVQANAASSFASVSANGGSVLFASLASNLVTSPLTTTQQLYVRDLATDQAPVVAPLADASVDEGATFTTTGSFSDADGSTSWTATVDWGDGSGAQQLALVDKTFSLSRLLAPGTYPVTVSVTDGEGLTGTASFHVSVANVAPTVNAGPDAQVGFGTTFAAAGSFTDPGTVEQYSATVDYGDGSGVASLALAPDRTFALSHGYAGVGTYTVVVTVSDSNGGTGTDKLSVAVRNDTFTWLSPTPTSANPGRTVPVHFTVTAPDGSFVLDQSVRVELLDANGTVVAGPLLWSSTPSSGVTVSDGVYLANLDTSKDAAADYTLRVSFSSPTLTGSFTRTLSLVGGNATAQHPNR